MADISFIDALQSIAHPFRKALNNGLDAERLVITSSSVTVLNDENAVLAEGAHGIQELIESHETSPLDAFWIIHHSPDCTETGFHQKRSYLKTTWKGFPAQRNCEQQIVEDFCYKRFGSKVDYVQGVCPCSAWCVTQSDAVGFRKASPNTWGGTPTETRRITLDIGDHGKTVVTSDEIV